MADSPSQEDVPTAPSSDPTSRLSAPNAPTRSVAGLLASRKSLAYTPIPPRLQEKMAAVSSFPYLDHSIALFPYPSSKFSKNPLFPLLVLPPIYLHLHSCSIIAFLSHHDSSSVQLC